MARRESPEQIADKILRVERELGERQNAFARESPSLGYGETLFGLALMRAEVRRIGRKLSRLRSRERARRRVDE